MKILILSKRIYTNKDLIQDQYGRVFEFSRALASKGHRVYGVAFDYRRKNIEPVPLQIREPNLEWISMRLFPNPVAGIMRYFKVLTGITAEFRPDLVLSVSDVYHVLAGDWLSRRAGLAHIVDLYDNYESFGAARIPAVIPMFRRALARADGIVCVSQPLARFVRNTMQSSINPCVVNNAVDTRQFSPKNITDCRRHFGLPEDKILVGVGGSISRERGIQAVFDAHKLLLDKNSAIHLVLAGALEKGVGIPQGENIHYLGELDYSVMPLFYCSLNVGIIAYRESAFSRYCFPQKFFEMLACGTPMVVAETGEVGNMMGACGQALFRPEDASGLALAIDRQLQAPCVSDAKIVNWSRQGAAFSDYIETMAK